MTSNLLVKVSMLGNTKKNDRLIGKSVPVRNKDSNVFIVWKVRCLSVMVTNSLIRILQVINRQNVKAWDRKPLARGPLHIRDRINRNISRCVYFWELDNLPSNSRPPRFQTFNPTLRNKAGKCTYQFSQGAGHYNGPFERPNEFFNLTRDRDLYLHEITRSRFLIKSWFEPISLYTYIYILTNWQGTLGTSRR